MFRTLVFVALLGMAACVDQAELTPEEIARFEAAMAEADPDAMRVKRNCIPVTGSTHYAVALTEAVFDGRFLYAKRTGLRNGYLVEFTAECDNIRRSLPPHVGAVCRGTILNVRGERCFIDRIYSVPDETVARALALKRRQAMAPLDGPAGPSVQDLYAETTHSETRSQ